jgi:CheY-like chemotaxis protein
MSHEIRTPMNAILGFSQLMQCDPEVTARQRKQLDTINRSGEHLLALINDILEISKIEAGRVTLNPTAFDLHALLNDLEMMFRVRTDVKKLQFAVERIGEVPRFVVSDEGKLRQVLINLLGNAVKFTKEGGIILRVRALHEETQKLRLRVEVEDTGPGIAAEDMGRLFHHFEQTETGRKSGSGTGLGLAISREFVRLMGGDISVRSQVDRGSLFEFNIALKEANPAAVVMRVESSRVTGLEAGQPRYRVLVADDKEDNRELLSQMLGPIGFQIRQVANGEEAVKEFETWGPSLILMDLRMPVMDGYEAIRRIRASAGGKDTRIIAVTASAFEETRKDVLADGADDFVSKPFRETELLEKIGCLLGVKYVYAEAVSVAAKPKALEALTSESLAGLPGELVHQIREATINADLDRMLELIQQGATHDARAANGLRSLAERFDYQKLLDLLPTGGTTNGTAAEP